MSTPTLARSPAKTYVDFISGPVKIKDALYIGDEVAARVPNITNIGYGFYYQ